VQYTRNVVTGASTADVGIILVDARKGLLEQSRRHTFIATLLRIPHLVVAVNKMGLVGWDEDRFAEIKADFPDFATRLEVQDLTFVPVSALHGDNVSTPASTRRATTGSRCYVTWSRSTSPRTATSSTYASPSST